MLKRDFLKKIGQLFLLFSFIPSKAFAAITKIVKTNTEWKKVLTPEQYDILRNEGTERPFTSPLNEEKREGDYVCAACNTKLFHSSMKYDSGTGWPSFFSAFGSASELVPQRLRPDLRVSFRCLIDFFLVIFVLCVTRAHT